MTKVKNTVTHIIPEYEIKLNIKLYRVGQPNDTKKRPFRKILKTHKDVLTILKNKIEFQKTSDVRLSSDDKTVQGDYLKIVRTKLLEWYDSGEKEIYIKYLKVIPILKRNSKEFSL